LLSVDDLAADMRADAERRQTLEAVQIPLAFHLLRLDDFLERPEDEFVRLAYAVSVCRTPTAAEKRQALRTGIGSRAALILRLRFSKEARNIVVGGPMRGLPKIIWICMRDYAAFLHRHLRNICNSRVA